MISCSFFLFLLFFLIPLLVSDTTSQHDCSPQRVYNDWGEHNQAKADLSEIFSRGYSLLFSSSFFPCVRFCVCLCVYACVRVEDEEKAKYSFYSYSGHVTQRNNQSRKARGSVAWLIFSPVPLGFMSESSNDHRTNQRGKGDTFQKENRLLTVWMNVYQICFQAKADSHPHDCRTHEINHIASECHSSLFGERQRPSISLIRFVSRLISGAILYSRARFIAWHL